MKVLFTTNIPSPYRVDFFNELGKFCDLTVLFEKSKSNERDDSWTDFKFENFKGIILKSISIGDDKAFACGFEKYLKDKSYDLIVCCNYSSMTGLAMIEYMRLHRIPYIIEGDGGFAKNGKGLRERIKKYFISGALAYLSTAKEHDKYYLTYGAKQDRIYRYPFTSVLEKDILQKPFTVEEKIQAKNLLGVKEKTALLTVGQFIPRKGFDVLIKAMAQLSKDIGCYIVGGEPPKEYLELLEKYELTNVHFVGFQKKESLRNYYKAADFFVLPTREDIWGLVVNEAMAQGLPVISTERCVAALELVQEGKTGFVVPIDDARALAQKIEIVANNEALREAMSEEVLRVIRGYTIEEMAKRHLEIFDKCKS